MHSFSGDSNTNGATVQRSVTDLEVDPLFAGDSILGIRNNNIVRGQYNIVAIRVIILSVEVHSGLRKRSINWVLSGEFGSLGVKVHWSHSALSCSHVRAGEWLNLVILQGTVLVVETFRASRSRRGQILECLELPISPADHVIISVITNLLDLLRARFLSKAGTKLRENKWNAKTSSVLVPAFEYLTVPRIALGSVGDLRFSISAFTHRHLAAVGVIV